MNNNVLAQVVALPTMPIKDLKKLWQELYRSEPPPYNKAFLVKRLAYRLQELAMGGKAEAVQRRLESLAQDKSGKFSRKNCTRPIHRPITGTRLIREWKGVEHHVTVLADGFEYQGQAYRSLSMVARTITGTSWNGLVFFGIKRAGEKA